MPPFSSDEMHYTTATKVTAHGAPCVEDGVPGIAIKQKAHAMDSLLASRASIAIGEDFAIETKRRVRVPDNSYTKGQELYIVTASNALATTSNSGANPKFGVVVELPGERGLAAGVCRVDLEKKDQF